MNCDQIYKYKHKVFKKLNKLFLANQFLTIQVIFITHIAEYLKLFQYILGMHLPSATLTLNILNLPK